MENREYESPKITVISLEPDASLMGNASLPGTGNMGVGDFNAPPTSTQPNEPNYRMIEE